MTLAGWLQYIGNFGVDIFFVLSGFVIAMTATKPQSSAIDFWIKRAARVYPLFWVTLFVAMLLPAIPGSDPSLDALMANPASLLLLTPPDGHPPAWTLVYEVQFYILAGVFMLFGVRTRTVFLTWTIVQVGVVAVQMMGRLPLLPITDALTLEFCFGVLIALLVPRDAIKSPIATIAVSLVAMIGVTFYFGPLILVKTENTIVRTCVWGLPAAIVVMSLISLEARGARFRSVFLTLGDESYSIYMWHISLLVITNILLTPIFPDEGRGYLFVMVYIGTATLLTLTVGKLSYKLIEKPALRMVTSSRPRTRWSTTKAEAKAEQPQ